MKVSANRSAGILLHPTSLPGPGGIGTLGGDAHRFAEQLAAMGMSWWQVLPVGPTGYADSPYQSPSTFAGNPLLIELQLPPGDSPPDFPTDRVDFGAVIPWRMAQLGASATVSKSG